MFDLVSMLCTSLYTSRSYQYVYFVQIMNSDIFISPGRSFRFHWIYQRFIGWLRCRLWNLGCRSEVGARIRSGGQASNEDVRITWGFLVEQFR